MTFNSEDFIRRDLAEFPPYSMGHVPLADLDHLVKLDLNENPYGPSPKAIAALAEMRHYNRYVGQEELCAEIARYVGVDPSHIVASNGADESIDWIQRMFLDRGDAIVDCPPSFEMYGFFARVNGAKIIAVPRREDFSLDIDAVQAAVAGGGGRAKLVFIANPSNPDGGSAAPAEIERLLALPVMIVLDEAYAEFAGESYAARVPTQPNLIVVRTFSKWAGMAGLRVGYCIAPKPIAAKIWQCKSPENVNAAGIVAARASLADAEYLLGNVRRIVAERERLAGELERLGFKPRPSRTNFVLCRVEGVKPQAVCDALASRGILVRVFNSPRMADYLRVSVGTPAEDDVLLKALRDIVGRG